MEVIGGEGADKLGLNDHGPISIYLCSKTEVDQCFSVISIGKEPRELFPLSTDYSIYCNSNRDKNSSTDVYAETSAPFSATTSLPFGTTPPPVRLLSYSINLNRLKEITTANNTANNTAIDVSGFKPSLDKDFNITNDKYYKNKGCETGNIARGSGLYNGMNISGFYDTTKISVLFCKNLNDCLEVIEIRLSIQPGELFFPYGPISYCAHNKIDTTSSHVSSSFASTTSTAVNPYSSSTTPPPPTSPPHISTTPTQKEIFKFLVSLSNITAIANAGNLSVGLVPFGKGGALNVTNDDSHNKKIVQILFKDLLHWK